MKKFLTFPISKLGTGPHRVIFMGDWRPKEHHDTVSRDLVDRTLVAVHGRHHAFHLGSFSKRERGRVDSQEGVCVRVSKGSREHKKEVAMSRARRRAR